jgi:hypothetical protein
MSKKRPTVLEEADRLTRGDRQDSYGDARKSLERIAVLWGAILDVEVTARQVALCMIALKISRESNAHKRDNWVDIVGYVRVAEMAGLLEEEA